MPHKRKNKAARDMARVEAGYDLAPGSKSLKGPATGKRPSKTAIEASLDGNSAASRILNAMEVQDSFRKRQRAAVAGAKKSQAGKKQKASDAVNNVYNTLKIQPGEKLKAFNDRVETVLAPVVAQAVKGGRLAEERERQAASLKRKQSKITKDEKDVNAATQTKKRAHEETDTADATPQRREGEGKTYFAEASQVHYLHEVAQAPPSIKTVIKGSKSSTPGERFKQESAAATSTSISARSSAGQSLAKKVALSYERERVVQLYREQKAAKMAIRPRK